MHQLESCGGLSTKEAEGARIPSGETGAEGSFDNEEEINQPKGNFLNGILSLDDFPHTLDEKLADTNSSPLGAEARIDAGSPDLLEAYMKIVRFLQSSGDKSSVQKILQSGASHSKAVSDVGTEDTASMKIPLDQRSSEDLLSLKAPTPLGKFEGESMSHIAQQINPLGMPMTLETLQMCIQAFGKQLHRVTEAPEPVVDGQETGFSPVQPVQQLVKPHEMPTIPLKPKFISSKPHLGQKILSAVEANHEQDQKLQFRSAMTPATASLIHPFKSKEVSKYLWTQRLFGLSESGIFGSELHESDREQFEACIVFVGGFDLKVFGLNELSNIFSNYGNVSYALCFDEPKAAFVKYTVPETAAIAHKHLTKKSLAGHKVNIAQYAHFEGLDPCFLYCQPEIFVPRSSYRRFKQDIPKILNPISSCLHVCIFFPRKRRTVGDLEIVRFMKKSGVNPIQVKRDVTNTHINMWFVEYEKSTEAVLTLMKLHDLRFEDGRVRISFTKSSKDDNNELLVDILAAAEAEDIHQERIQAEALVKIYQKSGKCKKKAERLKKLGALGAVLDDMEKASQHHSEVEQDEQIPLTLEKAKPNKKKKSKNIANPQTEQATTTEKAVYETKQPANPKDTVPT